MGLLLRQWRERRELSLHKLADRAGVSYVTIVRIEQGRMSPTLATLEKLAKALGITMRDFFPVERKPRSARRRT
jgi:transcriptional regulator with XRE-family HTH domain